MRRILAFIALLAAFIASPALAQTFPELTGRVVDQANIIPDDVEAQLTQKLQGLEDSTQRQLVVVTLDSLEGYDISDYGYQLGRKWGLGDEGRNDGALLIVAPNERKTRIEVGYGLEPVLTDALSSIIIQQQLLPAFRAGDYPGGIMAATDSIIQQLQLPPEEAARVVQEASAPERSEGGFPFGALIWMGFLFFFFILPMLRGGRKRRYRKSGPWGDIMLWEAGNAIARGFDDDRGGWGGGGFGGGGFGGGGFGGGGGFSGGGGSFGGGGASGGW